ncbi:Peptide deformylase 1 [Tepidimonas sediminis]|uniref:Peptide deformylase n=1 Tax=Tepidimonas sediminis TaxID=2588941 RepID=A0A554WHM2_9BURK|nr:peptide deformylase [Tepidimonas sediminis]TSE23074.1 Peptide deformylase 1 [Tepidimonas sediminis]
MNTPAAQPYPILRYPDPRLHKVARPVAQVDDRVREIVRRMFATMYAANGVGLAATQVDIHERIVVIDVSEDRNQPLVLINPELEWASPEKRKGDEGCLSVPGIYDGVERSVAVRVRALDEHGASRVIEAEGLLAVCIQHEMDHLQGKVFVEYLSPLKRERIRSKLLKAEREAARQGGAGAAPRRARHAVVAEAQP